MDGNFLAAAVEYLQTMRWKGQFSLDFFCYLLLSALWILWRNKCSGSGISLAIAAMTAGFLFFAWYLLYLVSKENGDFRKVLLGAHY